MNRLRHIFFYILTLSIIFWPSSLHACAVCFGAPDDPMTKGMRWGIATLIFVLLPVLGSVGGFFVFLSRRARAFAAFQDPELFKE